MRGSSSGGKCSEAPTWLYVLLSLDTRVGHVRDLRMQGRGGELLTAQPGTSQTFCEAAFSAGESIFAQRGGKWHVYVTMHDVQSPLQASSWLLTGVLTIEWSM
jgi:hypothetical protein